MLNLASKKLVMEFLAPQIAQKHICDVQNGKKKFKKRQKLAQNTFHMTHYRYITKIAAPQMLMAVKIFVVNIFCRNFQYSRDLRQNDDFCDFWDFGGFLKISKKFFSESRKIFKNFEKKKKINFLKIAKFENRYRNQKF